MAVANVEEVIYKIMQLCTCAHCYTVFWPNKNDCPKCGPTVYFMTPGPIVDSTVHYLDRIYYFATKYETLKGRHVDSKTLFSLLTNDDRLWISLGPDN